MIKAKELCQTTFLGSSLYMKENFLLTKRIHILFHIHNPNRIITKYMLMFVYNRNVNFVIITKILFNAIKGL